MRRFFFLSLLGVLLFASSSSVQAAYALDLPFTNVDNQNVENVNQYEGKYLLIDAWASYCEPCKTTMADLYDIHEYFGDEVAILSINVFLSDTEAKMDEFISDVVESNDHISSLDWDFGQDHTEVFLEEFSIGSIPTLVLINPDGTFETKWVGVTPPKEIVDYIEPQNTFVPRDSNLLGQLFSNVLFQGTAVVLVVAIIYFKIIKRPSSVAINP